MNLLGLKKMSKEKKNELVLAVLITSTILAGLGFGLIRYQVGALRNLDSKRAQDEKKLDMMSNLIKRQSLARAELETNIRVLGELEDKMASRDLYSWFIGTLRPFKQSYRVDIPQVGMPVLGEMTLLPKFPYKQATLSLAGTTKFHELGRFITDVENQFPLVRIINLDIEPSPGGGDRDTLSFRMELVTLVKPNAP